MNGLFNTVSNAVASGSNTGNSIMANGDTTVLAVRSYKCSQGTCATSMSMLYTDDLNGEVKCLEDNASCVLDGENARRGMWVAGTGSGTLILRALTFDKGYSGNGGGVSIYSGAIVDLKLLVFSNNRATSSSYGGGAIYVYSSGTTVNAYGTRFNGNTADSGNGDDIYRHIGGTITIHNTCPSPYSSNTPIQGSALDTSGTINGNKYSYSCTPYSCNAGSYNPTTSNLLSACQDCGEGKYSASTGATSDATCQDCSEGKFSTSTGATSDVTCQDCGEGKFSTSTGATSDATCQDCSEGKFSTSTGATSDVTCQDCGEGKYSTSTGATSDATCQGENRQDLKLQHHQGCTLHSVGHPILYL
ncbi:hypothetical protein TrCOL_g12729 [Triparma columacea]|uniref:Tyrosine-protein kinase ephrin type A/B receptor-like domain-containing protein n=1 Tax=Triparma columacea TaxID=722753 RepID=A0A9W7GI53_9STRA|nr:hypothetical protein TrCOL_g12729 [Triparma columacea]